MGGAGPGGRLTALVVAVVLGGILVWTVRSLREIHDARRRLEELLRTLDDDRPGGDDD